MELERQVVQAHRTGHPFTLAFIDIDSLKVTNDRYGHAAGDVLLVRVVDALRGVLRSYDLVVRYGGDEFLCGMTDLSAKEASRRFEEVNERLAVANSDSVSVGLAELTGESLESLIARADAAMYERREKRAL
jgi:diguanylate cyclase (GGDEF)-like protein